MTSEELDALLGASPYVRRLGARAQLFGDELTLVLPYREDLIGNPLVPAIHGGVIGAFMEMTATAQLFVQLGLKHFPKPIDISVAYLRAGRPKDLYARAIVTREGRRVANVRAEAWQDARSKPVAILHAHFLMAPSDQG